MVKSLNTMVISCKYEWENSEKSKHWLELVASTKVEMVKSINNDSDKLSVRVGNGEKSKEQLG